jgi:hypothetical protein
LLKGNRPDEIQARLNEIVSDVNSYKLAREDVFHLILLQGAYIIEDPSLEITIMQDRAKTACRNRQSYDDNVCVLRFCLYAADAKGT